MQAIILAGGKGARLRPYTTVLPKPLMPIGEMPILEILVRQLADQGINSIFMAVGYLHHMIEGVFKDGSKYGVKIDYSLENEPLGTAGPIKLVFDHLDDHFLVLNGDLLTNISFVNFFKSHIKQGAAASIATYKRTVDVDFGVLSLDDQSYLEEYSEKPIYDFEVSMGINMFKKSCIEPIINDSKYLDIPNLMMALKDNGEKVFCYREDCEWLDIGRIEDYNTAVETFESKKKLFLPFSK